MGILAFNLGLWLFTPISWLWWNLSGFLLTALVAAALSLWDDQPRKDVPMGPPERTRIYWPLVYIMVGGYFFFMVGLCRVIETAL